eukprot:3249068-Prymnesium_polylepis.1
MRAERRNSAASGGTDATRLGGRFLVAVARWLGWQQRREHAAAGCAYRGGTAPQCGSALRLS